MKTWSRVPHIRAQSQYQLWLKRGVEFLARGNSQSQLVSESSDKDQPISKGLKLLLSSEQIRSQAPADMRNPGRYPLTCGIPYQPGNRTCSQEAVARIALGCVQPPVQQALHITYTLHANGSRCLGAKHIALLEPKSADGTE